MTVNQDVVVRYSGCVGCYCSCGNRVKLDRETGSVLGVGGNPYNPADAYPFLDFEAPLTEAYQSLSYANGKGNQLRGTVCGRGNGTFDGYTQPDRITVPLKRAGKRGEGKWKAIGWDQLIKEVTEGGKLFAEIGEDREVMGFKELHDTKTPMEPRTSRASAPRPTSWSCWAACSGTAAATSAAASPRRSARSTPTGTPSSSSGSPTQRVRWHKQVGTASPPSRRRPSTQSGWAPSRAAA